MMLDDLPVIAIRAGHDFDHAALAAWLSTTLGETISLDRVQQFQGGQSNPTFLLTTSAGPLVLRKQPPGPLLPSAHNVAREYRILAALATTNVPVPQPRGLCQDKQVIGTDFYVMAFVAGRLFDQPDMPGCTPAERRAAFTAMADGLARLHRLEPAALGLGDLGRPDNFLARQIDRWGEQYRAANGGIVDPAMQQLQAYLTEHRPATSRVALVHGDYRLGNLLFAPDCQTVAAVLDWELTTLGDPFSDLAYCCLMYHLPPAEFGIRGIAGLDLPALGLPDQDALVAAYCQAAGLASIPDWRFYQIFSLYRLAAIAKGVHARALAGNASSADALGFGAQAQQMIAVARQMAGLA